jgi:ATP-binding protein involved in chromosome partitioning
MKIAVPVSNGLLCAHFGHCEQFALFEVDTATRTILNRKNLSPPAHEPGVLPRWLQEQGATVVIAGGMGVRAQNLFTQNNIHVVVGALGGEPEFIVKSFLDGNLQKGPNACDH